MCDTTANLQKRTLSSLASHSSSSLARSLARCAKLNYHLLPSFLPFLLPRPPSLHFLSLPSPSLTSTTFIITCPKSMPNQNGSFTWMRGFSRRKEGVRGPRTTRDTSRSSCPRARAPSHTSLPPSQVLFNYPAFLPALLSLSRSRTPSLSGLCFIGAHDTTPALASNLRDIWRLKVFFNSLGPEKKATKHYTGSR